MTEDVTVEELTVEEGREMLNSQTQKYLGISAEEFADNVKKGVYNTKEEPEHVMRLEMLLPFANKGSLEERVEVLELEARELREKNSTIKRQASNINESMWKAFESYKLRIETEVEDLIKENKHLEVDNAKWKDYAKRLEGVIHDLAGR